MVISRHVLDHSEQKWMISRCIRMINRSISGRAKIRCTTEWTIEQTSADTASWDGWQQRPGQSSRSQETSWKACPNDLETVSLNHFPPPQQFTASKSTFHIQRGLWKTTNYELKYQALDRYWRFHLWSVDFTSNTAELSWTNKCHHYVPVTTEMPPKQTTTWRELPLLWWTVIVTCTKLADAVLKQASAVVTAQPPQTVTNQHHETKHCKTHQTRHIINLYPFKGIKQNQAYIFHTSERITRSTMLTSILRSTSFFFLTVHIPTTKISTPQLGKTSNSQNQQNTATENFIAYSCFQLNKREMWRRYYQRDQTTHRTNIKRHQWL